MCHSSEHRHDEVRSLPSRVSTLDETDGLSVLFSLFPPSRSLARYLFRLFALNRASYCSQSVDSSHFYRSSLPYANCRAQRPHQISTHRRHNVSAGKWPVDLLDWQIITVTIFQVDVKSTRGAGPVRPEKKKMRAIFTLREP